MRKIDSCHDAKGKKTPSALQHYWSAAMHNCVTYAAAELAHCTLVACVLAHVEPLISSTISIM